METISLKKKYVRTDGWRSYEEPVNAVCGANNTGNWSDSPCPENVCLAELKKAKDILRQNKIPYKQTWCKTTNVFCIHLYICVHESNKDKAKELLLPLVNETRLLYIC
jgi:hypothetical protein